MTAAKRLVLKVNNSHYTLLHFACFGAESFFLALFTLLQKKGNLQNIAFLLRLIVNEMQWDDWIQWLGEWLYDSMNSIGFVYSNQMSLYA